MYLLLVILFVISVNLEEENLLTPSEIVWHSCQKITEGEGMSNMNILNSLSRIDDMRWYSRKTNQSINHTKYILNSLSHGLIRRLMRLCNIVSSI